MKILLLSLIIFTGLCMAGCKKQLDIQNPNQKTEAQFWATGTDAVNGVNAIYSTLHRGSISRWMLFYYIIRSDEGRSQSPATDIVNNMDKFDITDYNYGNATGIWNDNYVGIFRANQVLDHVPSISMDTVLRDRYIGEAKFLRALFYYNLASIWGNVPLQLHESTPEDVPPTASRDSVWLQVETDLADAAAKLPAYYGSADVGRATKGAAYALLARAYMQQHKYTEALTPLQWLVEGDGKNYYDLMADYRDNFLSTTENNKESVFEWQFGENPADQGDDDVTTPPANQNYGQSIAKFFSPPGVGWSDGEANRWPVWEFLRENTVSGDRDPRLAATFLNDSTDPRGPDYTIIYGQTFTQRYGTDNLNRNWFRKFLNDATRDYENYESPNNYRMIRYADVLLMYAECLNATGKTADAYQYVDRVRQRAGLEKLSVVKPGLSQDDFLTQLKHERLTELCGEGNRWNDLARWGDLTPALASRDAGFANFVVGKHELLPIPQQDIDINPNLKQNPGY